jgi:hypothetical protein
MDWMVPLVVSVLGFTSVITTYVRGRLLRRTVRTAIRELPATMTSIEVRITDRHGPSAAVQASAKLAAGEG